MWKKITYVITISIGSALCGAGSSIALGFSSGGLKSSESLLFCAALGAVPSGLIGICAGCWALNAASARHRIVRSASALLLGAILGASSLFAYVAILLSTYGD